MFTLLSGARNSTQPFGSQGGWGSLHHQAHRECVIYEQFVECLETELHFNGLFKTSDDLLVNTVNQKASNNHEKPKPTCKKIKIIPKSYKGLCRGDSMKKFVGWFQKVLSNCREWLSIVYDTFKTVILGGK